MAGITRYLWKFGEGYAKLLLVNRVQLQAGLFSFPGLPQIVLIVSVHKNGVTLLISIKNLIWNLQECQCSLSCLLQKYYCSFQLCTVLLLIVGTQGHASC